MSQEMLTNLSLLSGRKRIPWDHRHPDRECWSLPKSIGPAPTGASHATTLVSVYHLRNTMAHTMQRPQGPSTFDKSTYNPHANPSSPKS